MDAEEFNLDSLISSMKELRQMQLNDQVRQALERARLNLDPALLNEAISELETDIEEHIERLERISGVMQAAERAQPETMVEVRRQEVAFQSGCDLEDVDSLCEAFTRAREILNGMKQNGGTLDIRLLFANLPGLTGMEFSEDGEKASNLLRGILDGTIHTPPPPLENLDDLVTRNADFEALFDLERVATPTNRLPKRHPF